MKYIKKKLTIDKVKIEDIAKKFGTPSYCYSYFELKKNINNFKKNFKSFSPLICFAIKSNTNVNLIKEIQKFGLGADVVSMGELMMALKAGIDPKKIVSVGIRFNPNVDAKTLSQISTGKKENKFGIGEKEFLQLTKYIKKSQSLNLKCLSVHIGIQIHNVKPY